jgi:hypothetical protein
MNRLAGSGAETYKDGVTGQPGTQVIPVPPSQFDQGLVGRALMGLSRASDSPNSFRPNLYFARPQRSFWPGAGMPISVRSDNLMPVPATDPRGVPARLARPIVQRGPYQLKWRRPVTEWPGWNG